MDKIIIRPATMNDIDEIVNIHVYSKYETYYNIWDHAYLQHLLDTIEEKKADVRKNFTNNHYLVATMDGRVIGFARYLYDSEYHNADSELCSLYVKNDCKHLGVGSRLFKHVKNDLIANGKKKMVLWCLKDNYKAIGFYYKNKGVVDSESTLNFGGKEYDAFAFVYELN